ncbi:MAG: ABC transporter ATP-binding protein [Proteobacteria bacterium]|nr:ABC transporter ATP-binding protein [Pseudomonadota bacterium]MCP4916351.1 ABC transporter ATP-binding protein [Pseudomonadota bacterium]
MISLSGLGYRYPAGTAVSGVDLQVRPGEMVLLTGPTGCGKSTVLRLAAGLLQRHGHGVVTGTARIGGRDPGAMTPAERVQAVGFVGQEPADQLVAGTLGDELAFGMESVATSVAEMEARLPQLMALVGLDLALDRSTLALSGGQTQRLIVGASLAAGAQALLLDEPIAQLDPAGAVALLERLRALADGGVAILVVEHRVATVEPFCDRVVRLPGAEVDLGSWTGWEAELGDTLFSLTGLRHRYPGADDDALRGVDLMLQRGERLALVGPNGSGKSTLLGRIRAEVACQSVPQDPDLALFCETVRQELAIGPDELGLGAGHAERAAEALSLTDLLDRPPQALSRGQRMRCAVAASLACAPDVLLLDEPTSGQDADQVERMMRALSVELADAGLVFATHDLGLVERHATRVVELRDGRLA